MKKLYFILIIIGTVVFSSAQTVVNSNDFEFAIYPNTVNDKFTINTQEILTKMEVVDLLGRTVKTENNISKTVDVSNLEKGIYILKLTSEKGVSIKKYLKNKRH